MIRMPRIFMSLNDPRWGRSGDHHTENNHGNRPPQEGPPDLDQLWRDFNKKLSGLFGNKRSSGGSGFPTPPSGKAAGLGVGLVAVVVFVIWCASGFYVLPEGQQAVIQTFGKYETTVRQAGFHWRMPTPVQSHEIVNVSQQREVQVGYRGNAKSKVANEALMLTDDENIIDIQFAVQYRIREDGAKDFVFNNRQQEEAVKQAAETAMREIVAGKTADAVLYESRADVNNDVAKLMQGILDRYKTGILISNVAIQNVQPPEQVQAAFDDALRATQDRERAINEGKAYANDVIPRANGAAARLLQEAEGYRQRVIDQASGDAARFGAVLREYAKSPAVTRDRMYIDTMQQVYQNASKVWMDSRQTSPMLYLPLDQLLKQQSGENASRSGSVTSPAPLAAPSSVPHSGGAAAEIDPRSRESSRSRERDTR